MSQMVERVARAILAEQLRREGNTCGKPQGWEDAHPSERADATAFAKEAIAAMREPTEAMMDASRPAMREVDDRLGFVQMRSAKPISWPDGEPPLKHAWRAMIDAALK